MSALADSSSIAPPPPVKEKKKGETYQKVLDVAETVLKAAKAGAEIIPDPAGPIVKGAIGVALEIVKIAKDVKSNKEDMGDLVDLIQEWTRIIADSLRGKSAEQISEETREDLVDFFTRLKEVRNNIKDVLLPQSHFGQWAHHGSNQKKIIGYKEKLTKAYNTLLLRLMIDTNRVAEDIRSSGVISSLGGAKGTKRPGEDEVPKCFPDTRITVLRTIRDWFDAPQDRDPRVFWLKGVAGSGKSSISASIAAGRPRAIIFYFSRADQPRNDRVVLDLASQLAIGDATLKKAIVDSLENYRKERHQDVDAASLEVQLEVLLFKPLQSLSSSLPSAPVILDALDEWSAQDKAETLIKYLVEPSKDRVLPFKVIVTSRPDVHLIRAFATSFNTPSAPVTVLDLQDVDRSDTARDLRKYIEHRRSEIVGLVSKRGISLPPDWLKEEDIDVLVDMSSGVFQLAATILRDVARGDPRKRLKDLLVPSKFTGLDVLYAEILEREFGGDGNFDLAQQVLGFIVTARTPMSGNVLAYLLNSNAEEIHLEILEKLPAMFKVPLDWSQPILPIHPTVADYLTSKARGDAAVVRLDRPNLPKSICVDPPAHHASLVHACLSRMNRDLEEDICDIKHASLMNSDSLVQEKIQTHIPTGLRYSVLSWAHHLNYLASVDKELVALLDVLFEQKLLGWLEVLSLINELQYGISFLSKTVQWFMDYQLSLRIDPIEILSDLQRFIGRFFIPISASALQIYRSALLFNSPDTLLCQTYYVQSPDIHFLRRPEVPDKHMDSITCIAFSPDNKSLASGSNDKTVRLRDVATGTLCRVLDGHAAKITCITFSSNNKYLASGSQDTTVRLWNAITGILWHVLLGHEFWISDVAFSPDSKYLASSSTADIRLWDPATGTLQHVLSTDQAGSFEQIAFSPDSKHLASRSRYQIQLWDPETETLLWSRPIQPLLEHPFQGGSMVFSPDGEHIAFLPQDEIVWVWSVWEPAKSTLRPVPIEHKSQISCIAYSSNNGHLALAFQGGDIHLCEPASGTLQRVLRTELAFRAAGKYQGCMGARYIEVKAIAFSPDTKYMAASSMCDVLLWNPATGTCQHVLQAPGQELVTTITFSADSKCLAFGSYKGSIWLGDPETGVRLRHQPEVLTEMVKCIAFSSDGKHLVSGTEDKTVQVWDPASGTLCHILDRHTDKVTCVIFSSNNKYLASGSRDGSIRVWDIDFKSGAPRHYLEVHEEPIGHLMFDSDGKRLTVVSLNTFVAVCDLEAGAVQHQLNESLDCFAIRSDGKQLASIKKDKMLFLWDIETGAQKHIPGHSCYSWNMHIVFSPDNKQLAYICAAGAVLVWDLDIGVCDRLPEGPDWVRVIISSSFHDEDKADLITSFDDKAVHVWKPNMGAIPSSYWTRTNVLLISWIAFSSNGKHLISGAVSKNTIQMWNIGGAGSEHASKVDDQSPETTSPTLQSPKLPEPPNPRSPYNLIPERFCFAITETGWLFYRDTALLWLPTEFRPNRYDTNGVLFSNGCLALCAPGLPILYVSPSLLL